MKKTLFLVVSGLLLVITTLASPLGKTRGEHLDIPIHPIDDQVDVGRPRSLPIFTVSLDVDFNVLFVSTLYYAGEVEIVIENLTTCEHAEDTFDSSMTVYFPISGNAGSWRIEFTLESGDVFIGEFEL